MTGGAPSAPAAVKALATSLPIVFVTGGDPVAAGLVASLDRPGGNLTGINVLNTELSAKRVQLLHEIKPSASVIAALVNPRNPNAASQLKEFQIAADAVGSRLQVVQAGKEAELDAAFATLAKLVASGLVIGSDVFKRPERKTRCTGAQPLDACDLFHSRIRRGGRPHELRS